MRILLCTCLLSLAVQPSWSFEGSCTSPHDIILQYGDSTSITENPCGFDDSMATHAPDYVLRVKAWNSKRIINVAAVGNDILLSAHLSCKNDSLQGVGSEQVALSGDQNAGIKFTAISDQDYYVVLEMRQEATCRDVTLQISAEDPANNTSSQSSSWTLASHTAPTQGDSCSNPLDVSLDVYSWNTQLRHSGSVDLCDFSDATGRSPAPDLIILLASHTDRRSVSVTASGDDTYLSVFTSCPESFDNAVVEDDDSGEGYGSSLNFTAVPGTAYYIVLEPYDACHSASYVVTAQFLFSPPSPSPSPSPLSSSPPPSPSPAPSPSPLFSPPPLGFSPAPSPLPPLPPAASPSPFPGLTPIADPGAGSCSAPYDLYLGWLEGHSMTVDFCAFTEGVFTDFAIKLVPDPRGGRITVTASGVDTTLTASTACTTDSDAQVAWNGDTDGIPPKDEFGNWRGSQIEFDAAPNSYYYVILEIFEFGPCGEAKVTFETKYLLLPPPPASAPDSPATCDRPSIPIALEKDGDFFKLVEDTCQYSNSNDGSITAEDGTSVLLGSKDFVIQLPGDRASSQAIRASVAVSNASNAAFGTVVLVSKNCSVTQSDDGKVAAGLGIGASEVAFVAQTGVSYYIIYEIAAEKCGFLDIHVEVEYLIGSGATTSSCEEPYSVALGLGEFRLNAINTCEQANSIDGILPDAGSENAQLSSKDFVMEIEAYPATRREIKCEVQGWNFAPIIIASTVCSESLGNNTVVAWGSTAQAQADGSFSITFVAEADTAYYVALEAASGESDSSSCGQARSLELSVISSMPSLLHLGRSGKAGVNITVAILADWDTVQQNSESVQAFKEEVCTALNRNLIEMEARLMSDDFGQPCQSCVVCGKLSQGSVIVPATVLLKDDVSSDTINAFSTRVVETHSKDLLKGSNYEGFVSQITVGSLSVELTQPGSSPESSSESSCGSDCIAPAVVVPLFVVLLAVFLLFYTECKVANCSFSKIASGTGWCLATPFILLFLLAKASLAGIAKCCNGIGKDWCQPSQRTACWTTSVFVCGALFYFPLHYSYKGLKACTLWIWERLKKVLNAKGTKVHTFDPDFIDPKRLELDDSKPDGSHKLGEGGFAQVMRGQMKLRDGWQQVAIKIPTRTFDEDMIMRFKVEAAATIQHSRSCPHVVECYGWSELNSAPCLVMKLYARGSLQKFIEEQVFDKLPVEELLKISLDIALGLEELHNKRTMYDDLKPGNVLLSDDGTCLLADFGLARAVGQVSLIQTLTLAGTVLFCSPEKLGMSSNVCEYSFASDIWSLGITLAQLADSDLNAPYYKEMPIGALVMQLVSEKRPPEPLSIPYAPRFEELIRACLKLDPSERPTASQVVQRLRTMLEEVT